MGSPGSSQATGGWHRECICYRSNHCRWWISLELRNGGSLKIPPFDPREIRSDACIASFNPTIRMHFRGGDVPYHNKWHLFWEAFPTSKGAPWDAKGSRGLASWWQEGFWHEPFRLFRGDKQHQDEGRWVNRCFLKPLSGPAPSRFWPRTLSYGAWFVCRLPSKVQTSHEIRMYNNGKSSKIFFKSLCRLQVPLRRPQSQPPGARQVGYPW